MQLLDKSKKKWKFFEKKCKKVWRIKKGFYLCII